MSKILLLVRHAKSSWDDPSLNDFERPLNERGKKDAPEMAKKLNSKKIKIDAFVSSPAKRARQTCKYFTKEFDLKKRNVVYIKWFWRYIMLIFQAIPEFQFKKMKW